MTIAKPEKPLPQGWRYAKLGEVVTQVQAGFACGERDDNGIIQLRMNNITPDGNFNWDEVVRIPADFKNMENYWLHPNDVIFNNTNSVELVGKSVLFKGLAEDVVFSNHFSRLTPNHDRLESGFLSKWLIHTWTSGTFAEICNRWVGQAAVPREKLLAMDIPLPPIAEQRRIVAALEAQLAAVERARNAAAEILSAVEALNGALMRKFLPL